MKNIEKISTEKDLIDNEAILFEDREEIKFYKIGNQRYIVKDKKVVYKYFFDDRPFQGIGCGK